MWTKVKWTMRILVLLFAAAFLHYTLPQHDIVRITDTYNRLTTVGSINKWFYSSPDTGTAESATSRDIRFINGVFPDGSVIVYRNEDTGWIWPPYFKYDSSNLQAEAGNFKSTEEAPKWVSVTHYGWRFPFESIYPNAVKIREVAGPDVQIFPYLNIAILVVLAIGLFMLRRMWLQFLERMIDPALVEVAQAQDRAKGAWGRFVAWIASLGRKA